MLVLLRDSGSHHSLNAVASMKRLVSAALVEFMSFRHHLDFINTPQMHVGTFVFSWRAKIFNYFKHSFFYCIFSSL